MDRYREGRAAAANLEAARAQTDAARAQENGARTMMSYTVWSRPLQACDGADGRSGTMAHGRATTPVDQAGALQLDARWMSRQLARYIRDEGTGGDRWGRFHEYDGTVAEIVPAPIIESQLSGQDRLASSGQLRAGM